MADAPKHNLHLRSLKFISAVDRPAQPHAVAAIIKSATTPDVLATFDFVKADAKLGIVIGWAITSKVDGKTHHDLQGDHVLEEDLVRVAYDYVTAEKGASDEQHDSQSTGQCVFLMPLTSDICKALGLPDSKTGLVCGIKVSADVLAKFELPEGTPGKLTGWSIAGAGVRSPVGKADATKCKKCSTEMAAGAKKCAACGTPTETSSGNMTGKSAHETLTNPIAAGSVPIVPTTEKQMTPEQIAELNAALLRATKYGELTDAQKSYYTRLDGAGQAAFLAKSATDRAAQAESAVVHKSITGEVFYATDDQRLVNSIKANEALQKRFDDEQAARKSAEYLTEANVVLKNLTGVEATAVAIVKALREGIKDPAVLKAALDMIQSGSTAAEFLTKANGHSHVTVEVTNAQDAFYAKRDAWATAAGMALATETDKAKATRAYMQTREGGELYKSVTAAMPSPAAS